MITAPKTDAWPDIEALFEPLSTLTGVGAREEKLLAKLLSSPASSPRLVDVLWHLPTGYVNRQIVRSIGIARPGELVTIAVTPISRSLPRHPSGRQPSRVACEDSSGEPLNIVFFKAKPGYVERVLPLGSKCVVSGRLTQHGGHLQITHPERIVLYAERFRMRPFEPVYSLTLGLTQQFLHSLMLKALDCVPTVGEWLDGTLLATEGWPGFSEALHALHDPRSEGDLALWPKARKRLAFDEIYASQLAIQLVRRAHRQQRGRSLTGSGQKTALLRASLPFELTPSQEQAIAEIKANMASPRRMLRLLQGDVGSGKTVVAALAMATAVEAGAQVALMAPTDVLARQHHETLRPLCERAGIVLDYLSGRDKGKARRGVLERLAAGETNAIIGTHALFQPEVRFNDLGLAIIDEQHRFGVTQRLALQQKARHKDADILVMTATPIPRTLLLSIHGDLDVSQLREKPAGRKPVLTRAVPSERMEDVINGLHRALGSGAQVYWVCATVETGIRGSIAAAEARYAHLRQIFGERVGLVHGKLSGPQKDRALEAFTSRETSILVATTVIEVGVNVPDATVMIIENAELFGLSQLHQLRGRVGRGTAQSSCILLYKSPPSKTAQARMDTMREIEDGFVIAEEDLRLRGGGDTLGAKQSGDPDLRIAIWPDACTDIATAHNAAKLRLLTDPYLRSDKGQSSRIGLHLFDRYEAVQLLGAG